MRVTSMRPYTTSACGLELLLMHEVVMRRVRAGLQACIKACRRRNEEEEG